MNRLSIWTIYERPDDFPDKWVVRRFAVVPGGPLPDPEPLAVCDSYEEAVEHVPEGCFCLGRATTDDPAIYESWV